MLLYIDGGGLPHSKISTFASLAHSTHQALDVLDWCFQGEARVWGKGATFAWRRNRHLQINLDLITFGMHLDGNPINKKLYHYTNRYNFMWFCYSSTNKTLSGLQWPKPNLRIERFLQPFTTSYTGCLGAQSLQIDCNGNKLCINRYNIHII